MILTTKRNSGVYAVVILSGIVKNTYFGGP